ncbi:MAG: 6,7-dimethyl-8-ribityllumazine synthase [Candidatus Edwardsbacteria bacterium RIFOXYD12_FULL_50_11]|jgi:6,7-dimethyl-8-ribityllumazine synthase|uniref:6,7-dimethyl-8-ribityllumazine synthase n=1 Tax=Candidatus Edwardsbacteria bacterium GWF2_54_11 TaxID=1817851 RepID=A0A1F5RG03_9BACT|nr:6,7-dimethyl-8-ribityllumazine synthase [Candidatus Edwardsbacteria bacterium]OGF01023.1 MAG: 6,7-dimethyl-8-ribityllumazine synthase [Candidatus Edwardsbacteria bacterium RifOxyC12_full_54_24]OGF07940.1 MAG: 6,7-dimethyl-8-ribityllumazine synthase [Candidatus Edwardsbacteria bacterium RifOxyA12_full_54_48]OGF10188.1 MAG: 6,7-dimethyl-8-ribityllumazine synthase [Candidatus Edwardsbacteria bacterium GWE2_54_12]OGF12991.1 MAG: 6,7-dimethyl-8-ribityllumazine synthase [Candidatus Edwardsbacteria
MPKIIEGHLSAADKKFCLVVSRFNDLISQRLVDGALDCITRHGGSDANVELVWVPGSFEIPGVAARVAASKKYQAVICLGAVIRGDTPHFDYIAAEVAKGVAQVSMNSGVPTVFGVITTDNLDQALDRAGSKAGNKGWQAALSAIELTDLYRKI